MIASDQGNISRQDSGPSVLVVAIPMHFFGWIHKSMRLGGAKGSCPGEGAVMPGVYLSSWLDLWMKISRPYRRR